MVIEKEIASFAEWFLGSYGYDGAAVQWLAVVGCLALAGIVLGGFMAVVRGGPAAGVKSIRSVIVNGIADIVRISPRRLFALGKLAVKESIRKKIVVVFAVFIFVLMLAGWFLDPDSANPGRLYLSFVLTATSYMVLLLALFLSVFSLPTDIRNKTLHTVVTKPVRPSEIVLGRILGFTAIGTVLLVLMGVLSYLFVVQGLNHSHEVFGPQADDFVAAAIIPGEDDPAETGSWQGKTGLAHGHRHSVKIDASGETSVEPEHGHTHELTVTGSGDKVKYELGPPLGSLMARVPIYGKLLFRDSYGVDKAEGVNVGDEWFYRSFVLGGTQAAAIWTFHGLREADFPGDEIPVEMTLGVFRTHMGKITRPILGSLSLRNPETGLSVDIEIFESREFEPLELRIPKRIIKNSIAGAQIVTRKTLTDTGYVTTPPPEKIHDLSQKNEFNLFEDLVADGEMEIWLRCLEQDQYFGAAQPDLYLRADDASVELNFVKGYFGIWLQMVLVIAFGVMFSTFLSGPVAMIATLGALLGGFFSDFMMKLALGTVPGGGPVESFGRLLSQQNVVTELDPGLATNITVMADSVLRLGLGIMSAVLPPFGDFSYANYLAYGFDVSWNVLLIRTVTAISFLLPLFVAGHLFLRNREVAR
jgi:hypothetical protein